MSRKKKKNRVNHKKTIHTRNHVFKKKISYEFSVDSLKRLFSQYSFEDVALSITASEVWLPNRSSGVKHQLIWGVLASMKVCEFTGRKKIGQYSEFISLLRTVYSLLPQFPMLEDFVPQADWGDIRVNFNNQAIPVFFGGNVERITDFINAFEIKYASQGSVLDGMEAALITQAEFINLIAKNDSGSTKNILPGSLSIPTAVFWSYIKEAIEAINQNQLIKKHAYSHSIELGSFELPDTESEFSESIMQGLFQKTLFINFDKRLYPVSIRNFASIMMVHWSEIEVLDISKEEQVKALSRFINANVKEHIPGPNIIYEKSADLDLLFPSLIISGEKLFIPIPISSEETEQMQSLSDEVVNVIDKLECIEFFNIRINHAIRLSDDFRFRKNNIKILFVLMDVSTSTSFLETPKEPAHLICLSDFVTLISSYEQEDSLEDVFSFKNESNPIGPMTGIIDRLAAYKDSHSILVDGASSPSIIFLDPHYGCEWRYKNLLEYWKLAPKYFPIPNLAWEIDNSYDGISSIVSKTKVRVSWYTTIGECELHFLCAPTEKKLDINNFRVLVLAIECFADAFQQRHDIISDLKLFDNQYIFVYCEVDSKSLINEDLDSVDSVSLEEPVFMEWFFPKESSNDVRIKVTLNLKLISHALTNATDASFQARCVGELTYQLSNFLDLPFSNLISSKINETASKPPRMTINVVEQLTSVPEIPNYKGSTSKNYKLARKELAYILKNLEVEPGCYELLPAKAIIDKAKAIFRDDIHQYIRKFDKHKLLVLCVEQHDQLTSYHRNNQERIRQSLKHEVSFDRTNEYSKSSEELVKDSKNYRYLIEYCVGFESIDNETPRLEDILNIIGKVDWLMVLYSASDILHNDIDVGGLVISEDYVPEIFYSDKRQETEDVFKQHEANLRLGVGVNSADEVRLTEIEYFSRLDEIFEIELGYKFSLMMEVLEALSRWVSFCSTENLAYAYQCKKEEVVDNISKALKEENIEAISKAVDFLTLDANKTRILIGKDVIEADVPVWEHNKRPYRYTIRPIISLNDGVLLWGAEAAYKAKIIWSNSVIEGYLPFDLDSVEIAKSIRKIKISLEKKLEIVASKITSRFAPYYIPGIDFKRRFSKCGFEDVGDYDVLAYWPNSNLWVTIECKYIQPPFCIKDSRRLRDKMFEASKGKSHLCKIKKRREFLTSNFDAIRTLLQWPVSESAERERLRELYVSKHSYWWMFATPYSVPTEFVQIDLLEGWFKNNLN